MLHTQLKRFWETPIEAVKIFVDRNQILAYLPSYNNGVSKNRRWQKIDMRYIAADGVGQGECVWDDKYLVMKTLN